MKSNRHIISYIFLILFSCIQLADLHSMSHDANDVDCKICKLASNNLDDTFISSDIIDIPVAICLPVDTIRDNYINQFVDATMYHSFLNKAPPVA